MSNLFKIALRFAVSVGVQEKVTDSEIANALRVEADRLDPKAAPEFEIEPGVWVVEKHPDGRITYEPRQVGHAVDTQGRALPNAMPAQEAPQAPDKPRRSRKAPSPANA